MESFGNSLFKSVGAKVRQLAFNLSETELKVEEATNDDHWGPHGAAMSEIAELCFDAAKHKEIMQVLARRLTDTGEEWRHVYKALLLLEYLVKHGPMKVVYELQGNISFLEELQTFKYKDKNGKDHGLNVRNRAKELSALVSDHERVLLERETAQKNKTKYSGISNSDRMYQYKSGFGNDSGTVGGGVGGSQRADMDEPGDTLDLPADEDPFEATRKRIEKLKAGDEKPSMMTSAPLRQSISSPLGAKKEPKKLSQIKVNPEMAAAFSMIHKKTAAQEVQSNAAGPAADIDLLGDLDNTKTDTTMDLLGGGLEALEPPPVTSVAPASPKVMDEWSSFETGAVFAQQPSATNQPLDPFADMVGASPMPSVTANPPDPFSSMIGDLGPGLVPPAGNPVPDLFNPGASHSLQSNTIASLDFSDGVAAGLSMNPQQPLSSNTTSVHPVTLPNQTGGKAGFPFASGQAGHTFQASGFHFPGQIPLSTGQMHPTAQSQALGSLGNANPHSSASGVSSAAGVWTPHCPKETASSHQSAAGPMRQGAARPTPTRAKDPFADLAIL